MGVARFLKTLILLVAAAAAAPGSAQQAPTIAAAPAWVKPLPIPSADDKQKDKPLQLLLIALQSRYGAGEPAEHHVETVTLIQNPQGLTAAGNITIAWQPDQAELIVHKVEIIRGGKAEDVLQRGQTFTVLRRENNLEAATLDGVLTAVIQPEGLSVGDTLRVAWTVRRKNGSIAFRPENAALQLPGMRVRQAYYRDVWDKEVAMRWQASASFGKATVRKAGGTEELVYDVRDLDLPAPPQGAPLRYALNVLEISGYKDWAELSGLLAPLYASSSRIDAASPLKAEIDKIASAEKDPQRRTMAALRLVQDRIRYVAYAMGEAGYVPAGADQTWSRKFGDCKGKTAVLLALLSGLGIQAEPVLVSSVFRKAMGERLPLVRLFDHVIVRATIDGRSYWLDGTRMGDRSLAALASSDFGYGLPLRTPGSALEALPLLAPEQALQEFDIAYDASGGFSRPVPVSGKGIVRDAAAAGWRQILSQAGEEQVREALKEQLPIDDTDDVKITALEPEEASGAFAYSFSGTTDMKWQEGGPEKRQRFGFNQSALSSDMDLDREDAPGKDAPYELAFPTDYMIRETVTLPKNGEGFTVEGDPIDETAAATRFTRTLSLSGNRAVAISRFRTVAPEVSAAQARAAKARIAAIGDSRAWISAPRGYAPGTAERKAILGSEPKTASDFVERGYHRMGTSQLKAALADFDKAIEMSPKWARPHANRGVALVHLGRLAEAEPSLVRAREISDNDFVVHQGFGLLRMQQDRLDEALASLSRAIELDPDNSFSLSRRALVYRLQGRFTEAVADLEEILSFDPENEGAAVQLASIHTGLGKADAAIAAFARIKEAAEVPHLQEAKASMLEMFGRTAEATAIRAKIIAGFDAELAKTPHDPAITADKARMLIDKGEHKAAVALLNAALARFAGSTSLLQARCLARAAGNFELPAAQKDCDAAVSNDAGDLYSRLTRATLAMRQARFDPAIADCAAALAASEMMAPCYYVRGAARFAKGEKEAAERDLQRARRLDPTVDLQFRKLGLRGLPEARAEAASAQ